MVVYNFLEIFKKFNTKMFQLIFLPTLRMFESTWTEMMAWRRFALAGVLDALDLGLPLDSPGLIPGEHFEAPLPAELGVRLDPCFS